MVLSAKPSAFQCVEDHADRIVAIGDDGGINLLLFIEMLPLFHGFRCGDMWRVAFVQPHIDEKRLILVLLDERHRVRRRGVQIRRRPSRTAVEDSVRHRCHTPPASGLPQLRHWSDATYQNVPCDSPPVGTAAVAWSASDRASRACSGYGSLWATRSADAQRNAPGTCPSSPPCDSASRRG